MYSTGDPDRAPVRCTEPTRYAHTGPRGRVRGADRAWTGRPQRVDVSMQEVVLVANMAAPARFPQTGYRGTPARRQHRPHPRDLADERRLRVASACAAARRACRASSCSPSSSATTDRRRRARDVTGATFNQNTATDEELARHRGSRSPSTSRAHDAGAVRHRVRDEPHARARELAARDLRVARSSRRATSSARSARSSGSRRRSSSVTGRPTARPRPLAPDAAPSAADVPRGRRGPPRRRRTAGEARGRASNILEFGSGAAGPIATRYFVEHGATVLRVESKSRPDFLRVYALGPEQPARPRGRADVRRAQRRQAQRHAQPEASRRGRARAAARSSSGPTRSPRTSRRGR